MFPHRSPLIYTKVFHTPSSYSIPLTTHPFFFSHSHRISVVANRAPIPLSVWPTLLGTTQDPVPLTMVIIITAHHLAREKKGGGYKNNNFRWRGKPPASLGSFPSPLAIPNSCPCYSKTQNAPPFTDSQLDPVVSFLYTQQFYTFISFFVSRLLIVADGRKRIRKNERASNHPYSLTTLHNSESIKLTTYSFVRYLLLLMEKRGPSRKKNCHTRAHCKSTHAHSRPRIDKIITNKENKE